MCVSETTLRKKLTGQSQVIRTGVVVVALSSEDEHSITDEKSIKHDVAVESTDLSSTRDKEKVDLGREAAETTREKSGWLQKRGGNIFRKVWHKRYVRFQSNTLDYYSSDRSGERKRGSYKIDSTCTVGHASKESTSEFPNTFRIKGKRFDILFAAASALEEQGWIDCIRGAIRGGLR